MRKTGVIFASLLLLIPCTVGGCAQPMPAEGVTPKPEVPAGDGEASLVITSSAFAYGAEIPLKYSCDGQNVSPPLAWGEGPAATASFALIVDDPDAPSGVFTHWVIFNLPPDTRSLPEAVSADATLASGALQGENGRGDIGYRGPCPPSGSPHHYCFSLYALDKSLNLAAGASEEQLLQAMQGHILAQSQLVGLYQR